MSDLNSDFDGAWKETAEFFLPSLTELVLPELAAQIDWNRGFEFLDSELRSLFPETGTGRQHVDKVVRVFLRQGGSRLILLHIEIQSQADPDLPHRMFVYFYRIYDQYRLPIVSLAILADPNPNHRATDLDLRVAGSGCLFQYHSCKLTDFQDEFLEASTNPVAKVILAHRIAQRTAKEPKARLQQKLGWIRELFRQGFPRDQILNLIRALEAMNPLPRDLAVEFRNQVLQSDPEKAMPIITCFERIAREEGLSQGLSMGRSEGQLTSLREAIQELLEERFGVAPPEIQERLLMEMNPTTLKAWLRRTATIESPDAFRDLVETRG
ncbi:MAG: hypothetical protein ACKO3H_03745 [Verrucomicrobiota bacterium]